MKTLFALVFLVLPAHALAQSADQEVVSVVDAPDPVAPGAMLTYTITVTNNGPDNATNGGFNANLPAEVTYSSTIPAPGFACVVLGQNVSCTTPSFAAGAPAVFTMTVQVGAHLANFPDGSFNAGFFPSGTTPDPNNANNLKTATTSWDSPQIDLSLTVTDSPDPVFPDSDITYTVSVMNGGSDAATNVNFNVFNNGSLRFQSATVPAGWNCTLPAVNGTPTFTCTNPNFPPSMAMFIVVVRADSAVLGTVDATVSTNFTVTGTGDDTNDANNSETEDTAYVTPDADLAVVVTDSPDPVGPDNDITYTVQVTNNGPDTASNATLNAVNSGTLQFQSITVPAGWSCSPPAVNATPTFSCTNPSLASGASAVFTVVARASSATAGNTDTTLSQTFSAGSAVSDPNNTNNSETEMTQYQVPDADVSVTAGDAPDPVAAGSNITYSGAVANGGPDPATNATLTIALAPELFFQSLTGPAGFTCTTPAVGANGTISCMIAALAGGANVPFTVVAQVDPALNAGPDGTVQQTFTAGSATDDPVAANNSVQVTTAYTTPDADLSVAKTTTATAAVPGSTITYTIQVDNSGPSAATNVAATDTLPAGLTFVSATPSQGTCSGTTTVTCDLGTINPAGSATVTLVATVTATSGTISNTVSIASTETDPDAGDRTASTAPLPVSSSNIPTASQWTLILLAAALAMVGVGTIIR